MKAILKIVAAILIASTLLIGGCAALLGGAANEASKELDKESKRHAITPKQYSGVALGDTRASIEKKFGEPESTDSTEAQGMGKQTCIYYKKRGHLASLYQFCFNGKGKLDIKNAV